MEGESIIMALRSKKSDQLLFTTRRILYIDRSKVGITSNLEDVPLIGGKMGKAKNEFLTIPYTSVVAWGLETASRWDLDAELHIWTDSGMWWYQKHVASADDDLDFVDSDSISDSAY